MKIAHIGIYYLFLLPLVSVRGGEEIRFNRDIRPLLSENCFHCHGPAEEGRKADLRLDTAEGAYAEHDGIRAIVPGKPDISEAIIRIHSDDPDDVMPPPDSNFRLTDKQKDLLAAWIREGAPYEGHWSFTPPSKKADGPMRDVIDRSIRSGLKKAGLRRSGSADRETLIRRLSLDLRGLPPSIDEIDAFLKDRKRGAWERLVDRMLASPECAERLALDWLDVARFADTNGYSIDDHRDMWIWRDWLIRAFMENKPYDTFVIEQLAGDLLPDATPLQKVATGFLRNSMNTHEGGTIPAEYRVAYIADKIDTVSSTFLGLTMKCAQCHDHKYDPITMVDYYRFYAFFNSATEKGAGAKNGNTQPFITVDPILDNADVITRMRQERLDRLNRIRANLPELDPIGFEAWQRKMLANAGGTDAKLLEILRKTPTDRTADEVGKVNAAFLETTTLPAKRLDKSIGIEVNILKKQLEAGASSTAMIMDMPGKNEAPMLDRGQYDKPGEVVAAGIPAVFGTLPEGEPATRLALAKWIVADENPLTARVAVNRYWQLIFGQGIVRTAEDFGAQGEWPSHPELLDSLAVKFRESGWDIKGLLKEIVMSETYQQASDISPKQLEKDPANRLLARGARGRLPAELIRDNALAIGGLLDPTIGGPSVYPEQPDDLWRQVSHFGYGAFTAQAYYPDSGSATARRSMYTFQKRTAPPPAMAIFDAPTRETCTVRRLNTNTPLQALVMLNDPQFMKASRALADRMRREGGETAEAQIAYAFRLATARFPESKEKAILVKAFERERKRFRDDQIAAQEVLGVLLGQADPDQAARIMVASTLLNLSETITRR